MFSFHPLLQNIWSFSRFAPHRFYSLTLYNNAHVDTNLHTHGLHVSGVGTVDDVTRVAKPGECLVYNVSL